MPAPTTPLPDQVTTWICVECIPDGVTALDPPAASFSLPCCVCGTLHRPPTIRRVAVVDLMEAKYNRGFQHGMDSLVIRRDALLDAGEEADTVP